jgi:hypothetical protein
MGRFSGSERAEMRDGASDFSALPNMLINSVSGEVIVVSNIYCIKMPAHGKRFMRG